MVYTSCGESDHHVCYIRRVVRVTIMSYIRRVVRVTIMCDIHVVW